MKLKPEMLTTHAAFAWKAAGRRLHDHFDGAASVRATATLAPVIAAAIVLGDPRWLRASLVTIALLMSADRSGVAPIGVIVHAAAITIGFLILAASFTHPGVFIPCVVVLAAASILVTAKGAELRTFGNFTFVPALYLACDIAEHASRHDVLHHALSLVPFLAGGAIPVLVVSIFEHRGARSPDVSRFRHYAMVLRRKDRQPAAFYREAIVAVALAVAIAALTVQIFGIPHGQWVIWSAASVVTGDAASTRLKFQHRVVGAAIGVPLGVGVGFALPNALWVSATLALVTALTFAAFRRYVISFGVRSACAAVVFVLTGQSTMAAGERVANVALGCLIGLALVFIVHAGVALLAARHDKSPVDDGPAAKI